MAGNDWNGLYPPLDSGIMSVQPLPDESGRKKKPNRLVITGSPFGPQLLMLHGSDEDEETDPNP